MMDIRIKTRRELILLTMIDTMDKQGLDTDWVSRLEYLTGVRSGLLENKEVKDLSVEQQLTLVELNAMIAELHTRTTERYTRRNRGNSPSYRGAHS